MGAGRSIFLVIVLAAARFDFLPFIFNCWFAPALMVGVTLGLFFDYLPHRPFTSRNRWTNARIYPGRLMNWLIMGQNYHSPGSPPLAIHSLVRIQTGL